MSTRPDHRPATGPGDRQPIGGGAKKILYVLDTVRRIGVAKSAKALNSRNACKACGLGMGGQRGGMTNEQGEFPAVCNKSVQAQSTDIQPAIPERIFDFSIPELAELSGREIETLGRLGTPIHKPAGADRYRPIGWDEAIALTADRLAATDPDRAFFYASGRSSNEAGFLFQLVARIWGTNNVSNCSYYCHQATGVALGDSIGTGTSTVELDDLALCDTIFVIGANPASNHPRLIHKLADCRARGGQVIVINPAREPGLVKFGLPKSPKSLMTGGTEIASHYLQPRIGGDIALFKGLAKALLAAEAEDRAFLADHAEGFEAFAKDIAATDWAEIEAASGIARSDIEAVAQAYGGSKNAVFAWGMGMTHHLHGVENIHYIANLALLRGMIGRPGAGLLPLRGHSNVQGIGTIGVKPVLAEEVVARIEARFGLSLPKKPGLDTMAAMHAAARGEIDAAVLMGGNLLAANPDRDWAGKALDAIGFRLCLTTTLNHSHVRGVDKGEMLVLPVTARDEEWEPTTQESMFNYVRLSDGGIRRLPQVRPESAILAAIAERLLPDCGIDFSSFARHASLRHAIAEIVPEMADLADIDVARREFHVRGRLLHMPRFATADGKAHLHVHPLPRRNADDFPFALASIRSEGQFNSIIYEERDSYRGVEDRWTVLMNRDDMAAMRIGDGDRVDLVSAHGRMEAVQVRGFDVPRGDALAYYPEANVLIGTDVDARSRTPSFKHTPIRIEPRTAPPV